MAWSVKGLPLETHSIQNRIQPAPNARINLVTKFTSLVAVEEVVANPGGQSNKVAVPTELPAGMQMDKVFGAPATGTADEFLETLGITLLIAGISFLLFTWESKRMMRHSREAKECSPELALSLPKGR